MVDYRRVSEVLVGLEGVEVVGAEETGGFLVVEVRLVERPRCGGCGGRVLSKGWKGVRLVDQPCFGRSVRMVWRKRRWVCPVAGCGVGSFTERAPWVAPVRARLTTRAARWATRQVGEGRTVSEVAKELRCSWHTVSKEVNRWGEALLEADRDRVGEVEALGLDETLFLRQGSRRRRMWVTSAVDIRNSRLIDVFPGKTAKDAARWLLEQPAWWRDNIRWASLDLSGAYRAAYNQALPQAVQIADPFHVVRLANLCLDRVRRRVQEETLGHRGRKGDALYRIRKLLTLARERLDDHGRQRLTGLLRAGDPHGEVQLTWHAKETVRGIYQTPHPREGDEYTQQLAADLQDESCPPEAQQLGRTLRNWHQQIVAWHHAQVTNGPTESANNLIKRIKRVGFGFRNFRNYRTRLLLYAGKPNWNLLPNLTPP